MNILITGGTGFFGKALLDFIIANKLNSTNHFYFISRNPDQFLHHHSHYKHKNINFIQHNILEENLKKKLDVDVDVIIHGAANSSKELIKNKFIDLNTHIQGTSNIINFALNEYSLTKFIFLSSGAVYGNVDKHEAINEEFPLCEDFNLLDEYAIGKVISEKLINKYLTSSKIATVTLRLFSFIGSYLPLDKHFAVMNFINDALHEEVIKVNSINDVYRSFLDQQDMVSWIWTVLSECSISNTYNIGSDCEYSIYDLANLVKSQISPNKKIIFTNKFKSSRIFYTPNVSKIKNDFSLCETIKLQNSIEKIAKIHCLK